MNANVRNLFRSPDVACEQDERCWNAILSRDPSADGTFYYSVASTGVYCRPSCGARRPLRRNVAFHATCADAEAAGFRPCKRCRPDVAASGGAHAEKVAAACRLIETAETLPDLSELAQQAGFSRFHFQRVFKEVTGLTPKAYATAHRSQRMRTALQGGETVTDALYGAGFQSSSSFYAGARGALGMAPRSFRAGGAGMNIRYAIADSSLGRVLAAATTEGVCAILLGDDDRSLRRELAERFVKADIAEDATGLGALLADVVAGIEVPTKAAALPLDIRGTAFQQLVWTALRDIAPGETATYSDIARRIGKPNAVRAVGAACGANPIAVAVPCHRVVGSDGKLTGYRWGVERKRALLARERKPND